jgi:acetyltransferase-like isoleucine patch superfamily enzyme
MRRKTYNYIRKLLYYFRVFFKHGILLPDFIIDKNVYIEGLKNIDIGKNSIIFKYTVLNTYPNPYSNPYRLKIPDGNIKINSNTRIKNNVLIYTYNGFVKVGENCTINPFCVIYGNGGVTIGNNVLIATSTIIVSSNHVFADLRIDINKQGLKTKGIVIEDNVWIGANCTILDGSYISEGVIVAANSVVRGKLLKNSVYAGTPARFIKKRNE